MLRAPGWLYSDRRCRRRPSRLVGQPVHADGGYVPPQGGRLGRWYRQLRRRVGRCDDGYLRQQRAGQEFELLPADVRYRGFDLPDRVGCDSIARAEAGTGEGGIDTMISHLATITRKCDGESVDRNTR